METKAVDSSNSLHRLVVYGTMMSGLEDECELISVGAQFQREVWTAPCYRMWSIKNSQYAAVVRDQHSGRKLSMELWSIPGDGLSQLFLGWEGGSGFGFNRIELEDGSFAWAILAESFYVEGEPEITQFGGWKHFLEAKK